jgi:Ca-activated chloride channel family protein
MTFFWPEVLWLLLALPALVAGYAFLLRRRKVMTLKVSTLAMAREALALPSHV